VAAALEIDSGGGARLGMGREKRVAQRLSPSYSRTHLIAGAPHDWFAGDNYTPGEPNRWCAGNKVSPAIPGTCPPTLAGHFLFYFILFLFFSLFLFTFFYVSFLFPQILYYFISFSFQDNNQAI
jgi:hypothetical protein